MGQLVNGWLFEEIGIMLEIFVRNSWDLKDGNTGT